MIISKGLDRETDKVYVELGFNLSLKVIWFGFISLVSFTVVKFRLIFKEYHNFSTLLS